MLTREEMQRHREDLGLSRAAFGKLIGGLSEDVVRSMEEGRRPRGANAVRAAAYFSQALGRDLTVTDIWNGTRSKAVAS